jgi:hypothetical protein
MPSLFEFMSWYRPGIPLMATISLNSMHFIFACKLKEFPFKNFVAGSG